MKFTHTSKSILVKLFLSLLVFAMMFLPSNSSSQIDNYVFSAAPHHYCGDVTVSGAMCNQFPFFPIQNDTLRALVVFVNYPSPSGVYFYTFKANGQTKIERLVLLK